MILALLHEPIRILVMESPTNQSAKLAKYWHNHYFFSRIKLEWSFIPYVYLYKEMG